MKLGISIISLILGMSLLVHAPIAKSDAMPEFRLKTAFLYNFIAYTEWPDPTEATINLCVYGENSFGNEIDALNGRSVNSRPITVLHKNQNEDLRDCQVLFISNSVIDHLAFILDNLDTKPVLTIADSKDAASQGVTLNMRIENNKIVFEANIQAARHAGLTLSAKLLRLATKVYQ